MSEGGRDAFVIRLWRPADGGGDTAAAARGPRGVARHVGTGHAAAFRDGNELLALLRDLPTSERAAPDASEPVDPLRR